MAESYNGMGIGIFEMDSLCGAYVALDAAAKAADVRIQSVERNRLKSGACVTMRGRISDVSAAMEAAIAAGEKHGTVTAHHVIASPAADTEIAMAMTIYK